MRLWNFPINSAHVGVNHAEALRAFIAQRANGVYKGKNMIVVGTTGHDGAAIANQRARMVARFLRKHGVRKARIVQIRGGGKARPESRKGRQRDVDRGRSRSVEIVFVRDLYGVPVPDVAVDTGRRTLKLPHSGERGNALGKTELAIGALAETIGFASTGSLAPVFGVAAPIVGMIDNALSQGALKKKLIRAAAVLGWKLGADALPGTMNDGVARVTAGHLWNFAGTAGQIERWVRLSPGIDPRRLKIEIERSMQALCVAFNRHVARVEREFRRLLRKRVPARKRNRMYQKHLITVRRLAAAAMRDAVYRRLP